MSGMTIKVEMMIEDSIRECWEDAIRLSLLLDCRVEFDFKGVICIAYGGTVEEGTKQYNQIINGNNKIKLASSC